MQITTKMRELREKGEADLVIGSRFLPGGGIKGQSADQASLGWLGIARRLRGTVRDTRCTRVRG